jgi:NADPH:quinone reductase-like Zn-dependent oxidoreductase
MQQGDQPRLHSYRAFDYDIVLDSQGGDTLAKSLRVLKPGGTAIGVAHVEGGRTKGKVVMNLSSTSGAASRPFSSDHREKDSDS